MHVVCGLGAQSMARRFFSCISSRVHQTFSPRAREMGLQLLPHNSPSSPESSNYRFDQSWGKTEFGRVLSSNCFPKLKRPGGLNLNLGTTDCRLLERGMSASGTGGGLSSESAKSILIGLHKERSSLTAPRYTPKSAPDAQKSYFCRRRRVFPGART